MFPKAPLMPKLDRGAELARELSLPPGVTPVGEVALEPLPQSVLEARIRFTMLSRALGERYAARGVDLRCDVERDRGDADLPVRDVPVARGAHAGRGAARPRARRVLERDPLARSRRGVGGHRRDRVGHWAMVVPPNTRVWPFGRVMRLVAMGHKERDLVSYYLELSTRKNKT